MLISLNDLQGFQVHSICFIVWVFEKILLLSFNMLIIDTILCENDTQCICAKQQLCKILQ